MLHLPRWLTALEGILLFLLLPGLLALNGFHRPTLYTGLWITSLYCLWIMTRQTGFSWPRLWHGDGWSTEQKRQAIIRFLIATGLALAVLALFAPDRLFDFPRRNPTMWAMVIVFYPLISVVPQEFIYRCFFHQRYSNLLPQGWPMILSNGLCFGAMHIVLQNSVAPLLSLIGGIIFASSYQQHRSLKWASIEHAAYGCMIFTVGLGWYFFRGFTPPP